jgi:uncharacterized membrane protein
MEEQKPIKPAGGQDSNLMAALSYVWVLSVVMLVIKKDDEFVKFHAKQGTVLFVASVISWILALIVWILGPILGIVILIGCIIGFIKAISGEKYKLPVVGDLAEKIKM